MKLDKKIIILFTLFCVDILFTVLFYDKLPADIPMQFSSSGTATWSLPKIFGVSLLPLASMILCLYYVKQERLDGHAVMIMSLLLLINIAALVYIAFCF